MKRQITGSALIVTLLLMAALGAVIYGLSMVTALSQSNESQKSDLLLAQNYANMALFDNTNGGVGKILAFESAIFSSATYGATSIESMTDTNRQMLINNFFTNSCNGGPTTPLGFNKGLCSSESASGNNSMPLLRISSQVTKPCPSYSLTSIINGQTALPLIDDGQSRYSLVYGTGDNSLCHQPNFTLELLSPEFQIGNYVNQARLYRVTVRAFGRNGDTQVTMQAYFYVRCPNNICRAAFLNSQILN